MDLKFLEYYGIAHLISQEELDIIINYMIDNYDTTREFYKWNTGKSIISEFVKEYRAINDAIIRYADKICAGKKQEEESRLQNWEGKSSKDLTINDLIEMFSDTDSDSYDDEDVYNWEIVEGAYENIMKHLEPIARKRMDDRVNHRYKVGCKIRIEDYKHEIIGDQVEFFHDGGWGVTDKKGVVTISNILISQPSHTQELFHGSYSYGPVENQLYLTQNRDTGLYGVISLNPIKEKLPCRYREIKAMESTFDGKKHFAIKVLQGRYDGFWGCFNDKCKRIAGFKYDQIEFRHNYIECGRGGEYDSFYENDYDDEPKYVYNGVYDLYDLSGKLLIGEYDEVKLSQNLTIPHKFLYHSMELLEKWIGKHTDNQSTLSDFSWEACTFTLLLDHDFCTVLLDSNGNKFCPKGNNPVAIDKFPLSVFIPGEIVEIEDCFIISKIESYDTYIISKYVEPIKNDSLFDELFQTPSEEIEETGHWEDNYVEKGIFYITHIDNKGRVEWNSLADEYLFRNNAKLIRIGSKVGWMDSKGIRLSNYDAISQEFGVSDRRYVAKVVRTENMGDSDDKNNPNYLWQHSCFIQYYKCDKDGWPVRLEDNWDVFDPTSIEWFPSNFLNSLEVYPCQNDDCDYYDNNDDVKENYEWTEEDTWDAMTDGMYGDYPGSDVDYEKIGF